MISDGVVTTSKRLYDDGVVLGQDIVHGSNWALQKVQSAAGIVSNYFINEAHSSVLASVDVNIPANATLLTFDLTVIDSGNNDKLLIAIGDDLLGEIDLDFYKSMGVGTVSFWVGDHAGEQNATLNFYMPSDSPSTAKYTIGNVAFESARSVVQPTDISVSQNTVSENRPIGTTVGILGTTDLDTGDAFTYSLVEGDGGEENGLFQIEDQFLRAAAVFDFEEKNSYRIRVRSTDSSGLFTEKQFVITITNVVESDERVDVTYTANGNAKLTAAVVSGRL